MVTEPQAEAKFERPDTGRFRFRFGIRFMLLLTVMLAVVMTWYTSSIRAIQIEQAALARLREIHGSIGVEYENQIWDSDSNIFNRYFPASSRKKSADERTWLQYLFGNEFDPVVSLDINTGDKVLDLFGFAHLRQARFSPENGLESIESLENCLRLESIQISLGSDEIPKIDGIQKAKNLNEFFASGSLIESADKLAGLDLEVLGLLGCEALDNIDFVGEMRNLRSLSASGQSFRAPPSQSLVHLSKLETLYLGGCQTWTDLDGLAQLKNLTSLTLVNCKALRNVDALTDLQNLEKLELWGSESLENISDFSQAESLREIWLEGCSKLNVNAAFEPLAHVEQITIMGNASLVNLDGIENLTGTKDLSFISCKNLKRLSALKKANGLETIYFRDCKQITNTEIKKLRRNMPTVKIRVEDEL